MLDISSTNINGGSVNLTTEGTEDWLASPGVDPTTTIRALEPLCTHKLLGGRMLLYFDWANPGGSGFTQNMNVFWSAGATDSSRGSAIVSAQLGAGFFDPAILNLGWRMRVMASEVPRRLRVYMSHWSSIVTCTAKITDGIQTASATNDSGAAATSRRLWTIDYSTPVYGAELMVDFKITTGRGSSPNILFGAATVGVVP